MEFREEITPQMQEAWFRSIDNLQHNYFLVIDGGEKIGLINGSGIDWEKKETANGGIFIWSEAHLRTSVPLRASLLLTDVSFLLGFKRTFVKILKDNANAIRYNTDLGYVLLPGQEDKYNQQYVLESANYFRKTEKLRAALLPRDQKITIQLTDRGDAFSQFYKDLFARLSTEQRQKLTIEILTERAG